MVAKVQSNIQKHYNKTQENELKSTTLVKSVNNLFVSNNIHAAAAQLTFTQKDKRKNEKRSRVKTISPNTGVKTPERIVMKFCMMAGLPDVVTHAKLDGDRFGHFRVVGSNFRFSH